MTKKTWFTMKADPKKPAVADIAIYDEIGWWGVNAADFRNALTELGPDVKQINLRINSPGGIVFDGIAIHNMLARHEANVTVTIDGIAASIASLVAMAGNQIEMPENAMMMIHDPAGGVLGTADDMRDMADILDKIKQAGITSYARKSGLDAEEVDRLMAEETWLTAQEALRMGFADKVLPPSEITNLFDLARYRHPPEGTPTMKTRNNKTAATTKPAAEATAEAATAAAAETTTEETAAAAAETTTEETTAETTAAETTTEETAAAAAETTAAATVEDPVAEERDRCASITAACEVAGYPARASDFIDKGTSISEVLSQLRALPRRAPGSTNSAEEVSARHNPASTSGDDTKASWGRVIDRKNAQVR